MIFKIVSKTFIKEKNIKLRKKNHKVNIRSFKRFRYDKYMQVKGFTEFLFKGFLHTLIKEFTIICQLLTTYCHRLIIKSYFTFFAQLSTNCALAVVHVRKCLKKPRSICKTKQSLPSLIPYKFNYKKYRYLSTIFMYLSIPAHVYINLQ